MELAFFIFKVIPYNISLSLTLGDGLGSCTTRGRNSPKPRWISHSSRLAQPPLEPLHQQQGPSQHPVLSQDWRNWNIKLLALISLAFAFFFFLLPFLFWICHFLSLPSHLQILPSPSLTYAVSPSLFQMLLHWRLWLQTSQLHSQQLELTDHRLQSCVLRLPVASSQGWKNNFLMGKGC